MNNRQQGAPFLPLGAGFTVTQRSLNLSLLSSDLATSDLDLSSLVLSLRYSFDSAHYALFPYFHRVDPPPYSPSVSSTESFAYAPDMLRPERGTPEYAEYKQAKKDRKANKEREKSKPSSSLAVERPHSRAGSEFSVVSSIGSEGEGYTRSLDKRDSEGTMAGSISGYAGAHGYVSVGGGVGGGYQSSYAGGSDHFSPVSPVSSDGHYVAPQYNYPPQGQSVVMLPPLPQGQYPSSGPDQFPLPSPGIYSQQPPDQQFGTPTAPYPGYGPPLSSGLPPPGPYTASQISVPPPPDLKYGAALLGHSYSAPPGGVYQIPAPPPAKYPGHSSSGSISTGQIMPPSPVPSAPPHLSVLSSGSGLSIPSSSGLSIGGSSSAMGSGGLPPPSPSLQPYFGTYQSISPLPSPVLSPSGGSSFYSTTSISGGAHSIDSFSLGSSAQSSQGMPLVTPVAPSRPSTPPYDPSADAKAILASLKSFRPSPTALIQILPTLTPKQIVLLRREYKRIFKQVNVAKHIKTVFAATSFGKLAFAVALGPYESEAWFANCWYQKRETRNELLIEALMGKSNSEIRKIKDGFKDPKYDNSLEKAVRNELVANKFRIAVLAQLEGLRMEELEPGEKINLDGVKEDVRQLGEILERTDGRGGGETIMIAIVVNRSDGWIREMAINYRTAYQRDLPKAIMKHSKNLVGETLLHVINGAIDKPLRDAKLLEQAICALEDSGREDLLISRCVRVHWDQYHLERVKHAYKKKFKTDLGKRMRDAVVDGIFEDFLVKMVRD